MLKIKPGIMLYLKYLYPYTALTLSFPLKWVPQIIYNKNATTGAFELVVLSIILIIPLIKLVRFSFTVSGDEIVFKEGFFITRTRCIKNPSITLISIERGVASRLLYSARIKVYSPSGVTSKPIINAYVSRRSADVLQCTLRHKETRAVKRFRFCEILLYCFGNSSFIAGVFVAAPFINKILTFTGKSLAEFISYSLGSETPHYTTIINIALKAPIMILMIGYIFDFFKTFADMWSFKLTESENSITLRRGFIKLHTAFIPKESICAIVCRQTPIFSAFKRKSVSILSNGYGRLIKDSDCILPLTHEREHPGGAYQLKVLIYPAKNARIRPIKPYAVFMLITLAVAVAKAFVLPQLEAVQIILVCAFLYLFTAIIIRYENYNKCFLSIGSTLSVKAQHRLSLREMHLPISQTATIKITQNIFDKNYGVCKVRVYAAHKSAVSIKIKNLPLNKTVAAVYKNFICL